VEIRRIQEERREKKNPVYINGDKKDPGRKGEKKNPVYSRWR
jgi:hypothetical protein